MPSSVDVTQAAQQAAATQQHMTPNVDSAPAAGALAEHMDNDPSTSYGGAGLGTR